MYFRGQVFGLLIGVFGIVTGAIVTLMGHDVVGGGIAGLPLSAWSTPSLLARDSSGRSLPRARINFLSQGAH